ncbi:MAG TPA: hypothetical protein DCQ84_05650 [Candidatus Competibacteraceae bacterium]|nr:hypothetical protein [Candidatus Competibacteraceae bacterium]
MPGRMEFQLDLPKSVAAPRRHDPSAAPRFLIMADLSGRGQREASSALADLADRPLLKVDADSLSAVMARLAPKLRLPSNAGTGVTTTAISFAQLDDFHPDALYRRLEIFQILRRARARLLNPASFAQAIAELSSEPDPETPRSEPAALALAGRDPPAPVAARPGLSAKRASAASTAG